MKFSIRSKFFTGMVFLIIIPALSVFASYSNERITQLYTDIKKLGTGNYHHRLDFDGEDKFYEISQVMNEMADKLSENERKLAVTLPNEVGKALVLNEIHDLKNV
ncbi:MAG TPA: hypothetical protein VN249_05135 [Prolixibacteraceae bacterium]|nr:hypothetical protein [Prolixibacteraceae bacterium]